MEGAIIGFLSGIVQDVASGHTLGFYTILGLYSGIFIGSFNKRLYRKNLFIIMFFTFISTSIYEIIVYFLTKFLEVSVNFFVALSTVIMPEAIYNCIISILIYFMVLKINSWFENENKGLRRY